MNQEEIQNDAIEILSSTPDYGRLAEQQDRALIDNQIVTAKRYPRDISRVVRNAISIATMSEADAKECMYTLKKGKTITGPSVVLARIIFQNYQNLRVETKVVGFDKTHVTVEATAFDMENNIAFRSQVKKSIVGSSGVYSEDLKVITGNAAAAIAFRNVVFGVVPKQITDKIYLAAQEKIVGKLGDENKLIAKRAEVLNGLRNTYAALKLTEEEICKAIGKSSPEHLTKEDILSLVGLENSIRTGEMTAEEVFRPKAKKELPPKSEEKQNERLLLLIDNSSSIADLEKLKPHLVTVEQRNAYDDKFKTLKTKPNGKGENSNNQ